MKKTKLLQLFAFGKTGTALLFDHDNNTPKTIEAPPEILESVPDDLLTELPDEDFMDAPDDSFFIDDEPEPYPIDDQPYNDINDDYSNVDASDILHLESISTDTESEQIESVVADNDKSTRGINTELSTETISTSDVNTSLSTSELTTNSLSELYTNVSETVSDNTQPIKTNKKLKPLPESISVKAPIKPHTVNKAKPKDDNYDTVAQAWITEHGFDIDKSKAFII